VHNDAAEGRGRLAVSLSDDEGRTWKWKRLLEDLAEGSAHYPCVIQTRDGRIHVVYSYFVKEGKSMKHTVFTEAWLESVPAAGKQ
jgi:predicted neuraminidase